MQHEPSRHRRRRLRLAGDVQHQQHRQPIPRRQVGRGAATPGRRRDTVEQAHRRLDQHHIGVLRHIGGDAIQLRRRHRPAIQVRTRRAGRRGVECRVDVIRPGLGSAHPQPAPAQRRKDRQRQRGLAGARARRADDQSACCHGAASASSGSSASRRPRIATISPTTTMAGDARPSRARSSGSRRQGGHQHALARRGGLGDHRRRRVGRQSAGQQFRNDRGKPADRHVEHDRLPQPGQRRPIDGRSLFVAAGVAGCQHDRVVHAAQRGRDQRRGQARRGRR